MKNNLYPVSLMFMCCLGFASVRPHAKTVYMKDTDVSSIKVVLGRSAILNFPAKPSKVVLGNKNHFAVEYIDSDIAISALHPNAHCNLIVYLQGRRFSFDLTTSTVSGDEIVLVRDGYLKRKNKTPRKGPEWTSKQNSLTKN